MTRCAYSKKRCYTSKAKARKAARNLRRYYGKHKFYQCPHCGHWHLTTQGCK